MQSMSNSLLIYINCYFNMRGCPSPSFSKFLIGILHIPPSSPDRYTEHFALLCVGVALTIRASFLYMLTFLVLAPKL